MTRCSCPAAARSQPNAIAAALTRATRCERDGRVATDRSSLIADTSDAARGRFAGSTRATTSRLRSSTTSGCSASRGAPASKTTLELEIELLPTLAPALPVAVPAFEHVSREPLFVAYRMLRGTPLVNEDGDGMRAFLDALHAFDASGLWARTAQLGRGLPKSVCRVRTARVPRRSTAACTRGRGGSSTRWRRLWGSSLRCSTPTSAPHISSSATAASPASSTGATLVSAIPLSTTPGLLNGPFADWEVDPDLRRRAQVLPPARALVRGALRALHRPAGAHRARARGDQSQALSRAASSSIRL